MTGDDKLDEIDWSLTTWKGARLQQHREFAALPFRRKLEIIEGLATLPRRLEAHRDDRSPTVREDPPAAP